MTLLHKYFPDPIARGCPSAWQEKGTLSRDTYQFRQVTVATEWTCDIHNRCAQDLCRRPNHNFHSSLWTVVSVQLGFSIQELFSLPFHLARLFKHLLSYENHFAFTEQHRLYPSPELLQGRLPSGATFCSDASLCLPRPTGQLQPFLRFAV